MVVNSTIAKRRPAARHLDEARAVPGVLDILSHLHRPKMRKLDLFYKDMTAPGGSPFKPFHSDGVLYSGQPVALVLAETFEAARHAASLGAGGADPPQMFTFGHRPETWQRLKLVDDKDGTLKAVVHEAIAETSRLEDYVEVVVNWSGQLYQCDNVRLGYKLVALDQYSPSTCARPARPTGCMRWKWRWTSCRMP